MMLAPDDRDGAEGWDATAAKAVAFDLDGTLLINKEPLPGAVEVVKAVITAGFEVFYVTNASGQTRADAANMLRRGGFPASEGDVYTSASTTAAWLAARGIVSVAVLGTAGLRAELEQAAIAVVRDTDEFAALVVGLDRQFDFNCDRPLGEAAARRVAERHALFAACNRDDSYPGPLGEPRPGCGRLVTLVERQCGRMADAAPGKPQPDMLLQAAADRGLGPRTIVVVGDSVGSDVGMARAAGALWALVPEPRSGRTQTPTSAVIGDHRGIVIDQLADLVLALPARPQA